jgi:hypothetical protein
LYVGPGRIAWKIKSRGHLFPQSGALHRAVNAVANERQSENQRYWISSAVTVTVETNKILCEN